MPGTSPWQDVRGVDGVCWTTQEFQGPSSTSQHLVLNPYLPSNGDSSAKHKSTERPGGHVGF